MIAYIEENWETLYNELIEWNYQAGSSLESEITSAWEACEEAAERYGTSVLAMLEGIAAEQQAISSGVSVTTSSDGTTTTSSTVATTNYSTDYTTEDKVRALVATMEDYSGQWKSTNSTTANEALHEAAESIAAQLATLGVVADYDSHTGQWTIVSDLLNPDNAGKLLYSCYHSGGIVGGGTVESNEELAKLKDDEWVLSEEMVENLILQMERVQALTEGMEGLPDYMGSLMAVEGAGVTKSTVSNVINNNRPMQVYFGDTVINGASSSGVKQYQQITEESLNQMAKLLGIRR